MTSAKWVTRKFSVPLAMVAAAAVYAGCSSEPSNPGGGGNGSTQSTSGGATSSSGATSSGGATSSSGKVSSSSSGSTSSSGKVSSSSSSSGSTSSSGGPGATADLKCNDPLYGAVSIPGSQVISDFENNSLLQYVQQGRGQDALPWYAYAAGDTNDKTTNMMTTPGPLNPLNASNKFAIDTTQHGPCSTKGALHITSPGPSSATGAGYVGWGVDFMARPGTAKKKQAYDGSKYTGIGFWAKCTSTNTALPSTDLQFAFTKVVDAAQDADIDKAIVSSPCTYDTAPKCNQYGVKNAAITNNWSYYKMYFSELLQDPTGATFTSGVDPKKLVAFQIHVNQFSPRQDPASPPTVEKTRNAIDCYVDDVHFLSEAAPAPPTTTVTWSVSGNKIQRNGKDYHVYGIVRSSMEWDCAGFGITREDIMRMKTWHANTIRLPVLDTLWAGTTTGGATCNGGAYQSHVKRTINWILEQGMDVILDLHYVGGSPGAAHTTFWDTISKDAFFRDPRILFELYNEPTADINSIRSWSNTTIAKIRGNGATKNLILVSGTDYTYNISDYAKTPATDSAGLLVYVTHPYRFKPTPEQNYYLDAATKIPVIATEFGDANVPGTSNVGPTDCNANLYSDYLTKFQGANMSFTAWAWVVDAWGCGYPQMISDYSGAPNAIGTPVKTALGKLNP